MNKRIVILISLLIVAVGFVVYSNSNINKGIDSVVDKKKIEDSSNFYEINSDYLASDALGSELVNGYLDERVRYFKVFSEEDISERNIDRVYTLDISVEDYESEDYISYVLFISEYTGGANVNQTVESFVFDKDSRSLVDLNNVIPEEEKATFINNVKDRLMSMADETGIFEDQVNVLDIDSIYSFYLTDSDINLLFSKYEVAPGSAGIVSVKMPSSNLDL